MIVTNSTNHSTYTQNTQKKHSDAKVINNKTSYNIIFSGSSPAPNSYCVFSKTLPTHIGLVHTPPKLLFVLTRSGILTSWSMEVAV